MDISLIVPCYNEGPYLEGNLKELYNLLSFLRVDFEMIIIDDKSKNDTLKRVENFVKDNGKAQLLSHEVNQGRGYTVSEGIRKAKGKVAGFIDIDLEVASQNIIPLILKVLEGSDVATGKRVYKIKWDPRWTLSKGFNREKIFPLLDEIEDKHWFWDTEILTRSYYHGLKIAEVPVLFIREYPDYTTVKTLRDAFYYFKKLLRFRKVIAPYRKKGVPMGD